jgi:hypothetical protein
MKKVIRLTETDLKKIIERVISEQVQTEKPLGWTELYRATSGPGTNEKILLSVFTQKLRNKSDFDNLENYLRKGPVSGYSYKSIVDVLNGELGDGDRNTLDQISKAVKDKTGYQITYTPDTKKNSIRANTIKISKTPVTQPATTKKVASTQTQKTLGNTSTRPSRTKVRYTVAPDSADVMNGSSTLKQYQMGPLVGRIQRLLGFPTTDDKFGPKTLAALVSFQDKNNITDERGFVGQKTLTALERIAQPIQGLVSKGLKNVLPTQNNQTAIIAQNQDLGVDDFS